MFIIWLYITPPTQYPESFTQPPDTSQTLPRQPADKHLEKYELADQNYSNWIYVKLFCIIPRPQSPPSPIQNSESPRQPKTTPRHLPDTLQTPRNRALNGLTRIIERKGTSQFKQYSMLLKCCQFIWDDNPPGSIQSHPNNLQTTSKHPQAPSRQPQIIPHICHFFSTYTIFGSIFLHANAQKLAIDCRILGCL